MDIEAEGFRFRFQKVGLASQTSLKFFWVPIMLKVTKVEGQWKLSLLLPISFATGSFMKLVLYNKVVSKRLFLGHL